MRIEKIDKDMGSTTIEKGDIQFYDTRNEPFNLYVFYMPDSKKQFK